jgi:hypothetical protein
LSVDLEFSGEQNQGSQVLDGFLDKIFSGEQNQGSHVLDGSLEPTVGRDQASKTKDLNSGTLFLIRRAKPMISTF